ncbi:uncharacterized protein LOC122327992 [Puntigrus tetrazona]|uniref:uncharacterized protein LOC122327992 n=1 Tax=Puntigrus tetrazona TaxID=1606681 RepID=UPI001C8A9A70|nr:uncharacterized protein LOC122327992 [Puntigrus tetrazona]
MMFLLLLVLISFISSGVLSDEIEFISGMKGGSVTLLTGVAEVQRDDLILWTFENKDNLIAEIHKQVKYVYHGKEHFMLEQKTGSLSIINITPEHSGVYELTAISGGRTLYKRFGVTVNTLEMNAAYLPVPVIRRDSSQCASSSSSSSNCSLLCSVVNASHVTLSWYRGNSLLSSISVSDLSISLSLPLEVEHQDKNIYSCVINNPIRNQTQHLDVSRLCHTCEDSVSCCGPNEAVIRLVVSALVGVATVAAVIYDFRS